MSETRKIPIYRPPIMKDAQDALNRCFANGWWGYGSECKKLEQRFVEYKGGWALSTTSCTSSLYIVAKLLFTSKSDEVIVPSITWISTAIVFQMAGFKVRLADVNRNDLMIDIDSSSFVPITTTTTTTMTDMDQLRYRFGGVRYQFQGPNKDVVETMTPKVPGLYTFPSEGEKND